MNEFLYRFGVRLYGWLLQGSAPFHAKARKWVRGRQALFADLERQLAGNQQPVVWFHCASLGEFEQGRPVMEQVAQQYPQYKIALSFFSPSGYEVRRHYAGAHYIFYLPLDTAAHARRLLDLLNPQLAVFVKYEFWYFYLRELHRRGVPVISIAAIFRADQLFFKSYGSFYRQLLGWFAHIYTQNESSAQLLQQIGLNQVTVAGDTRFDRVLQTAANAKDIPLAAQFAAQEPVMVIGSSWPADLAVLLPFMQQQLATMRFILAPHELHPTELDQLTQTFGHQAVRYSVAQLASVADYRILIIDNIGLLAALYRYGTYAYIGGAFGKGLHNTLEAAVFGLPLFFGPTYGKFQEATDLVALGCAFPVKNTAELTQQFAQLAADPARCAAVKERAQAYIQQRAGATATIIQASQRWLTAAT